MNTFDTVSKQYADKSLVQKNAAGKLIELLDIRIIDSIIDIACGPGNITNKLSDMTCGKVVGIDISAGMIQQAKANYPKVGFRQVPCEKLDYKDEFDIAFCNSALQWFKDPLKALLAIYKGLTKGGKLGLACPATRNWSPFFQKTVSSVAADPEIEPVFKYWKNPWFQLDDKKSYEELFKKAGFKTLYIELDYELSELSVDDAFGVYLSGAANGFAKQECYKIPPDAAYVELFNAKVKEEFKKEAKNGKIGLDFVRLYYIGLKT